MCQETKELAYKLWESNGKPQGQDLNFWLQAEQWINTKKLFNIQDVTESMLFKFYQHCQTCITEEGFFPYPALYTKDNKITISFLDLQATHVIKWAFETISKENPDELIYGIDRYAKENQGTSEKDLLSIVYYNKNTGWTPGIIEYNPNTLYCHHYNWDNQWWNQIILDEINNTKEKINKLMGVFANTNKNPQNSRPKLDQQKLDEYEQNFQQQIKNLPVAEGTYSFMRELFFSSYWIAEQIDVDENTLEKIRFVHGQKSWMNNPWKAAYEVIELFKQNQLPEPGPELAKQLFLQHRDKLNG